MVNKSLETQLKKYGGEAGYSEEMKRRRKLVKTAGFAAMDKEKLIAAAKLGGQNRWKNDKTKESGQSS